VGLSLNRPTPLGVDTQEGNLKDADAATAAGFLAASNGLTINRNHFLHAIRREYEKSGKAFPG
jgi:hypothetical protein